MITKNFRKVKMSLEQGMQTVPLAQALHSYTGQSFERFKFLIVAFETVPFIVWPLKIGRNFQFGCALIFFFFFVFHVKSGNTINHRNVLSDISY